MIKNMGTADRVIRVVIAVLLIALYLAGQITGTALTIILGVVAAAFIITSAVGTCPAYIPFGLSTRRQKPKEMA